MSFEGMGKTIRTMEAPIQKADAPAHLSDEFPAGYSLTGCSPALPASASPAGVEHVSSSAQHRGFFTTEHVGKIQTKIVGSGSTLMGLFFCPRDGVHLRQLTLVKRQAGALCNPLKSSATVTVPAATSK